MSTSYSNTPTPSGHDAVAPTANNDADRARFERACEATPAKIAKRFAAMHAGRLCFVPGRDWFRWDGTRWLCDDTSCGHALTACMEETSQAVARDARRYQDNTKRSASLWRAVHQMLDRKGHRAVLEYAATDPRLAVSALALDAHPGLVNFANGTLDAETGALRPHRKDDWLTRVIGIPFDPNARCPTWDAFLDYALHGDHELIAWLQRCAGYSMTGYTNARANKSHYLRCYSANSRSLTAMHRINRRGTLGLSACAATYGAGIRPLNSRGHR